MTITTPAPVPKRRPPARRGFTLTELIISTSMSAIVLTSVLTMMLFLSRSGVNIANYADMESEARRGLERFAEDTRQASDIAWVSAASCTLTVNAVAVTYTYDRTTGRFTRTAGGTTAILLRNVQSFSFKAYMLTGTEVDLNSLGTATLRANASKVAKQLQISLRASRPSATVVTATNTVLSARFILRNKQITA